MCYLIILYIYIFSCGYKFKNYFLLYNKDIFLIKNLEYCIIEVNTYLVTFMIFVFIPEASTNIYNHIYSTKKWTC